MVDKFRAHLKAIPRRDSSQRVIAIIDAIASMPGVLMPWERMVQVCKEENVWSLVDAAHAIGQIPLDVHKADPDFLITVGYPPVQKEQPVWYGLRWTAELSQMALLASCIFSFLRAAQEPLYHQERVRSKLDVSSAC